MHETRGLLQTQAAERSAWAIAPHVHAEENQTTAFVPRRPVLRRARPPAEDRDCGRERQYCGATRRDSEQLFVERAPAAIAVHLTRIALGRELVRPFAARERERDE